MCWACQEGERERIWALVDIISQGRCRPGTRPTICGRWACRSRANWYREEQPDGTILIRQVAPSQLAEEGRAARTISSAIALTHDPEKW